MTVSCAGGGGGRGCWLQEAGGGVSGHARVAQEECQVCWSVRGRLGVQEECRMSALRTAY